MVFGFWGKLKRPIMVTAPMSGVSDETFRRMFLKYRKPDVLWTEFVPVDSLFSKGRDHCLEILKFEKEEHPIVAQIFGADPEKFEKAAELIAGLGFDGIDINMGCPDYAVERQGAGACLIKNPEIAKEIIRATKRGAGKIPVSVKTRIGYSKNEISEWIPAILKEKVAVLTVHLRTRKELSLAGAHWELGKEIVKLRDQYSPETILLGNGDIKSLEQAKKLVEESGFDGFMVGRGVIGDPWFFSGKEPAPTERLNAIIKHAEIFESLHKKDLKEDGGFKQFDSLKKHFHAYCKGFRGAKDLRDSLMKVNNVKEVKEKIENFLK